MSNASTGRTLATAARPNTPLSSRGRLERRCAAEKRHCGPGLLQRLVRRLGVSLDPNLHRVSGSNAAQSGLDPWDEWDQIRQAVGRGRHHHDRNPGRRQVLLMA